MPAPGFEPAITVSEGPQTRDFGRAATGIGIWRNYGIKNVLSRCGLSLFWLHLWIGIYGLMDGWVDGCAARYVSREVD